MPLFENEWIEQRYFSRQAGNCTNRNDLVLVDQHLIDGRKATQVSRGRESGK